MVNIHLNECHNPRQQFSFITVRGDGAHATKTLATPTKRQVQPTPSPTVVIIPGDIPVSSIVTPSSVTRASSVTPNLPAAPLPVAPAPAPPPPPSPSLSTDTLSATTAVAMPVTAGEQNMTDSFTLSTTAYLNITVPLLTTSSDGHLTTMAAVMTTLDPSHTAPAPTPPNSTSSNRPAIIGGVLGASLMAVSIIVTTLLFIKRRRRAREQGSLLEGGPIYQRGTPSIPGIFAHTTVIPFQRPPARGTPQHIMPHSREKQVPASHLLSPSRPTSPEDHASRLSMAESEEIRNQVMEISRRFDLNPLSTERSETPNPFSDSTVASESHVTPLPVGTSAPSPQLIDLIAERVVEMLRTQDPGFGGARPNMSPGNGGQAPVSRVSQLSRSDRSSTAPPTYATDEE